MRAWSVWYDSGTVARSPLPLDTLPSEGVIVIAQADEDVGRELLHLKDFYIWDHERWMGVDLYGLFDYLRRPGWKKVLAGRTVPHRTYHALMDAARLDPALPAKTARLTGELPARDG